MDPWPIAWTTLPNGRSMQVFDCEVIEQQDVVPGSIVVFGKKVVVSCGKGAIRLGTVQLAGSGRISASELMGGRTLSEGDQLGSVVKPQVPGPLVAPV
jgi:methionyl-tRNA formyltransferase